MQDIRDTWYFVQVAHAGTPGQPAASGAGYPAETTLAQLARRFTSFTLRSGSAASGG